MSTTLLISDNLLSKEAYFVNCLDACTFSDAEVGKYPGIIESR